MAAAEKHSTRKEALKAAADEIVEVERGCSQGRKEEPFLPFEARRIPSVLHDGQHEGGACSVVHAHDDRPGETVARTHLVNAVGKVGRQRVLWEPKIDPNRAQRKVHTVRQQARPQGKP